MQDFTVIRLLRYTDLGLTKKKVPIEDLNIQRAKLAKTKWYFISQTTESLNMHTTQHKTMLRMKQNQPFC